MNGVRTRTFVAAIGLGCAIVPLSAMAKPDCKFKDPQGNLLPSMTAVYVLHQKYEIYREFDEDCDGHLSEAETRKFEDTQRSQQSLAVYAVQKATEEGHPIKIDKDGKPSRVLVVDPPPKEEVKQSDFVFLLRDNAEDIGIFAHPKDVKAASGAQLSYSSDAAASNVSWTAKGVATAYYRWLSDSPDPGLVGFAAGPWVSFNRQTNSASNLRAKQLNVLSYGAATELGFGPTFLGDQYLRLKAAVNSDFDFLIKSWSATAEWQPVSPDYKLSYPISVGPMLLRVDPVARVQTLQRLNGSADPVFSQHDSVWRVGGRLAFSLTAKPDEVGDLAEGFLPKWLQSAALNLSFSGLWDTHTGQQYHMINSTLTIPLDSRGHIGANFSYQRGELEETGQWTDQVMIGLGLKW